MTTTRFDMAYGRRGGRIVDYNSAHTRPTDGPPCDVCGRPMLAGQTRRHFVCSPPCEQCGWPSALIPDLAKHLAAHDDETER